MLTALALVLLAGGIARLATELLDDITDDAIRRAAEDDQDEP